MDWSDVAWVCVVIVVGIGAYRCGYWMGVRSDRKRRQHVRDASLGALRARAQARRDGAVGSAHIETAEYRERHSDHGMEM